MKRIRTIGIYAAAIGVFGAVSAASAVAALPEVKTATGELFPAIALSEAGPWLWSTALSTPIKGTSALLRIEFSKAGDQGTYTADFRGATLEGEQCNTEGDADGVVLVSGKLNLVVALNAAKKGNQFAGAFVMPSGLQVLCGPLGKPKIKVPIAGSAIAAIEGVTEGVERGSFSVNLKCTKSDSGKQELKEYKSEEGFFEQHIVSANLGLGNEAMCIEFAGTPLTMLSNKFLVFVNIK